MHYSCDEGMMETQGVSSRQALAQATRSVQLLNAIEATVQNLASNTTFVQTLANETKRLVQKLAVQESNDLLDPDGRTCDLLQQASDSCNRIYTKLQRKREAARRDHRLTDDDGVEDGYTTYIAAVADFHNALEEARNRIADIDSLKSPVVGGTFTDVGALFTALGVDAAKH